MKFIHIADVHLGLVTDPGAPWSRAWTDDRLPLFQSIIDLCNQEQADLLLIAGDLFQQIPTIAQLKEVNYLFSTLKKTYVVLIAGNHDPITPESPYQDFQWCKQVLFLKKPSFTSAYFPHLDTEVCGFSYDQSQIQEPRYNSVHTGTRGKYQILLAHGGDALHVPINQKQLAEAGFDYVAMGHIHQPSRWPDQKMAYSGSLMATDCTDTGKRGYIIGEITDTGTNFSFVPCAPHEYATLRLHLTPGITQLAIEDQLKKVFSENPGSVYRLILEGSYDSGAPLDLDRLRLLGNILQIEDHSIPDYPLEKLAREHADDVVGMYLASFDLDHIDDVERKALYYGLGALLKGSKV